MAQKKFKDSFFGKLIFEKIPDAAKVIGDALPNAGVMGVAKNLINSSALKQEEKRALLKAHKEYEKEIFAMEIQDKANARKRQIEYAKTGKKDWMFTATGLTIIVAFLACVFVVLFMPIPEGNKEMFIHLEGMLDTAFIGGLVFFYYVAVHKK